MVQTTTVSTPVNSSDINGKAAADAYRAIAGIPIIGPIMAPIAAVAAFAARSVSTRDRIR